MARRKLTDEELKDALVQLMECGIPEGVVGDPEEWVPTGFYLLMENQTLDGKAALTAIAGHPDGQGVQVWRVMGWLSYALQNGLYGLGTIDLTDMGEEHG